MQLNRTDPGFCDPIGNFDADMNRNDALAFLLGIFAVFMVLAYWMLVRSSTVYE